MITNRLLLQIQAPPPNETTDQRLDAIFRSLNRSLDAITSIVLELAGLSGPVLFSNDINMQGHAIHNLADPKLSPDAANKRYVDAQIKVLRELIAALEELLHTPPAINEVIYLTRTIPVALTDVVDIGTFTTVQDTHALDIAITVNDAGFSVAKRYFIPSNRAINAAFQIVLPLSSTGPSTGQDFDLEAFQDDANNVLRLRIRRTLGATAGTAIVHIQKIGPRSEKFIPLTTTSSPAAITAFFPDACLSEIANNLVMNCKVPIQSFAGFSSATVSGTTKGGIVELITQEADAANVFVGTVQLSDKNSTAADKRVALMTAFLQGATANNRGGSLIFATKADAGAGPVTRLVLDKDGNALLGGATAIGTSALLAVALPNGTSPTGSVANQSTVLGKANGAGKSQPAFREEGNTTTDRFIVGSSVFATSGATVRTVVGTDASANTGWTDYLAPNGIVYQIPVWVTK